MLRLIRNILWGVVSAILLLGYIDAWEVGNQQMLVLDVMASAVVLPFAILRSKRFAYPSLTTRLLTCFLWVATSTFIITSLVIATDDLGAVIICLLPVAVVAILLMALKSGRGVRRRRATLVLAYLEQIIEMNLPLPQMLAAASASESGTTAERLKSLRLFLESGETITASLDHTLPELPPRSLALIGASERVGQLPRMLKRLVNEDRNAHWRDPMEAAFLSVYPLVMSIAVFSIISMIMIFVIPKFEQIFHDFRTDLPWVTVLMLRTARMIVGDYGWIIWVALLLFIVAIARDRFWPRRERASLNIAGTMGNRDLADAFTVAADGLAAGFPLDSALREAGELSVGKGLRIKLFRWARGIEQGRPTADAARHAQMPQLIVGMATTADVSNAHELFRFLARYYRSRFSRWRQLVRGAAIPAIVFFFAVIVGTVALSLFQPIVAMIDAVQPYRVSL